MIEGVLKQVQRRYAPEVEKALLTTLLTRYQQLPDAQRVAEFDAAFGRTRSSWPRRWIPCMRAPSWVTRRSACRASLPHAKARRWPPIR